MSAPVIKFKSKEQTEFFILLRKRVNKYFKTHGIEPYANWSMILKTAFMIGLYFIPFIILLSGNIQSNAWSIVLWTIMGFGMAGIGLSIMHDANHGSYSKNKTVNKMLGLLINFLGGYRINWQIQHNTLHHSYTNIDGYDQDIINPLLRMSPDQKHRWFHRFQAFYAPLLYGIMTLYWSTSKDFEQVFKFNKLQLLQRYGLTKSKALIRVILLRLVYFGFTLALPLWLAPVSWWVTLTGFVIMHIICGLLLALIFQTAHVIEETEFAQPDDQGTVMSNWAVHQMRTTANFAHGSRVFSWLIGGLNYQVEHHLFPNICHVHYRNISKIVKKTAREFGVPYHHHKTWVKAMSSHFGMLNQLGKRQGIKG